MIVSQGDKMPTLPANVTDFDLGGLVGAIVVVGMCTLSKDHSPHLHVIVGEGEAGCGFFVCKFSSIEGVNVDAHKAIDHHLMMISHHTSIASEAACRDGSGQFGSIGNRTELEDVVAVKHREPVPISSHINCRKTLNVGGHTPTVVEMCTIVGVHFENLITASHHDYLVV